MTKNISKDIFQQIIEAGNLAPSGSNSQPWSFKVIQNEKKIEINLHPDKDHPVLNFKNRGTYLALGALIENMKIASNKFDVDIDYELLLPENKCIVKLKEKQENYKHEVELFDYIFKRHSNRKPYKDIDITKEEKDYLFSKSSYFNKCDLKIIEDKEKIYDISKYLAYDVLINLTNKNLHQILFKEVIWKEDEQKLRPGLYVKTLEMVGPKVFVFKLLSNWKTCSFFNKIGLIKKIYEENAKTISQSSLLGFISIENKDENFVDAGRLLENVWLKATKLGLSFQLITGIFYFWQQVNFGNKEIFSKEQIDLINASYENIKKYLDGGNKITILVFRVGKSKPPLAVSYKRSPLIEWL